MPYVPFSPAEVFMELTKQYTSRDEVPHVVVGPLSDEQQKEGGISIVDAGQGREELYVPLIHPRFQMRCLAPTLDDVERIGRHVGFSLDRFPGREVFLQPSTGESYLVHSVIVSSGPSAHQDTNMTWEYLVFADTMMGTTPVSS